MSAIALLGRSRIFICAHCRMCQKAVGGAFAAIGVARRADLSQVRQAPAWFRSSMNVQRGFCPQCGTPLFYADDTSDTVGIMTGSFDRPGEFPPERQDGIEGRLDWVMTLLHMPEKGMTGDGEAAAWAANIARTGRQHPDFET